MTSQKNKILAFIKIDHIIDLITNSSSELFVIDATIDKSILVELVNESLKDCTSIRIDDIEDRIFNDSSHIYEQEWKINDLLTALPENARNEIKEKYLTKPNYYGVVFDRDWVSQQHVDVRSKLIEIGFELIDSDY